MIKISSSNVSKYLIKKLFYDEKNKQYLDYYDFTNEKDITKIIDNIRYYVFLSDFDGLTVGNTLSVYMDGEPYIINNEIILSKLSYLSENVKTFFHEIIGHLDIRFQYYLYKDQKYTSPKPKKPTPEAILRYGKEAGEFIEELLFGKAKKKMNVAQMLYVLDIQNYNKSLDDFLQGYKNCHLEKTYNISKDLEIFLKQVDIDIKRIISNKKYSCDIYKTKNSQSRYTHLRHPLNYKGYDEIYS